MASKDSSPDLAPAEVLRDYGPFPGVDHVRGVTFDGESVWFAAGDRVQAFDPESGELGRSLPVTAEAGTAFDGRHLFQLGGGRIQKIDPATGKVVGTIPAPPDSAGLTWGEGSLWVAQHRAGKIHRLDPKTGQILRTIESTRFVTGVTWVDGELWHGTWEDDGGELRQLRRVDPESGEVLAALTLPAGAIVTGPESDGRDRLFCGGGKSGTVRAVRRPKQPR